MANKYAPIIGKIQGQTSDETLIEPVLDEYHLNKIEVQLEHPLPGDYRDFLRYYAGVMFDIACFPVVKDGFMAEGSIDIFYTSTEEKTLADNYHQGRLDYHYIESSDGSEIYPGIHLVRDVPYPVIKMDWPAELLPIGSDAGGNEICLALFGLRPGAIFYWINAPGKGRQNLYLVADSFDEFMHLLRLEDEQ